MQEGGEALASEGMYKLAGAHVYVTEINHHTYELTLYNRKRSIITLIFTKASCDSLAYQINLRYVKLKQIEDIILLKNGDVPRVNLIDQPWKAASKNPQGGRWWTTRYEPTKRYYIFLSWTGKATTWLYVSGRLIAGGSKC